MLFWISIAILSAAVTYAVTRPLLAPEHDEASNQPDAVDIAVYKDQLREIERDRERGTISDSDAAAASDEVSRRLLRAANAAPQVGSTPRVGKNPKLASGFFAAGSVLIPALSLGAYVMFGQPGMPGQPLADRLAAAPKGSTNSDLVAKVEAALRANPDDGKGWDVIGPVYLAKGRNDDAAMAFANAMRVLGETPQRLMGFADARIRAQNGLVPEDARKAIEKVIAAEPQRHEPKIWLALAKEQDGDKAGAANDYRALLASAPKEAPWIKAVEERLALVTGQPAAASTAPATANAKAADGDQQKAINAMVEGLAERMKTEKTDLVGWQKLIRSYQVLGDTDKANQALMDARAGLASDTAKLQLLNDWLKEIGVNG